MVHPLVSILVPFYNVESFIGHCACSLFDQTYSNLEFIFVDDCSTDASNNVLEQVIKKYPNRANQVRILHHDHNRGVSAARNTGIEAASGNYFLFVDSDDEITTDCIEKFVEPLSEKEYDLVIGDVHTIGDDKLCKQLQLKLRDGEVLFGKAIIDSYRKKWNMAPWNKLVKLDLIRCQNLLFKDGLYAEDELWSFQVACVARSLRAVNQLTYIYCIRNNSLTTSIDAKNKKREALKIIVAEMRNFLMDRNICSASAYRLVQYFFWRILKPVQNNRSQFIQDYCLLRKATQFPLLYRVKAVGLHPRAQLANLYYLIPSEIAVKIILKRYHRR